MVPVLRDVDQMSFAEFEKELGELARRAQGGTIGMEELTGGTFESGTLDPGDWAASAGNLAVTAAEMPLLRIPRIPYALPSVRPRNFFCFR